MAYIGRSAGGSSDYYGGAIDDLRVYNYQLSAAEVTTLAVPDSYEITSPDGSLVVTVTSSSGSLAYAVSRNGNELIADSPLAIRKGEDHTVTGAAITSHDSTWEPTWGLYEQIRDHHNRLTLTLDVGGIEFDLIFKVFDDGLGFRFAAAEQAALSGRVLDFNVNYDLDDNFEAWWARGEHSPEGPHALNNLPSNPNWVVVIDAGTSGFFALLESDLYPAEAFGPIKFQRVSGQSLVRSNMQSVPVPAGDFITPWRTVLVGDEVGDLLESTVSVNVAAPLALEDASWVKPGKGFFNWRTLDYEADDGFTYKVDTATLKRLIDHAVDLGIDYVQIDDEWWTLIDDGGETIDQRNNFDIDEIMDYAASRGVNMTVYVDRLPSERIQNTTDEQLYQLFADKGAAAIKYGFRGPNAPFTREAIRSLADKEMVINFHDGPVPLTGARRTMPNAITRQTGWGQQDGRTTYLPTDYLEMAFINALLGPFDMINGVYDIYEMPDRLHGAGPIRTTIASENARAFTMFSAMVMLPDVPEEYIEKADMFEFIQKMPTTWDDTRILHGVLPEYITTARRSGAEWFVCSVTNETARTLSIDMDFLDSGTTYDVTYYEDDHDDPTNPTHYIDNAETYQVRVGSLTSTDSVDAIMVAGGGHCMWIRPQAALIARWQMDNDASDSVGARDGTLQGGAGFTTSAEVGSHALSLDGADDYVDLTSHAASFPLGDAARSITGWFRADAGSQGQSFFAYGTNAAGKRISIAADRTEASVSVSGHEWGVRSLGLSEGWHHIAVTYPARGQSDDFSIYIDGQLQSSITLSGTVRTVDTGAGVAYIGRSAGSSSDYYGGVIDDLRIYDGELSSGRVRFVG